MDPNFEFPWSHLIAVVTTLGGYLLTFVLVPRILLSRREAGATFAWILAIVFLPYLGALLFFAIGRTRVYRRARKKNFYHDLFLHNRDQLPHPAPSCDVASLTVDLPEPTREISRLASCLTGTPPFAGNRVQILIDASQTYAEMEAAINKAKHHIHLMSYIFRPDQTGARFRDLLLAKAREQVKVRILVDGVGSHALPRRFFRPLLDAGASFARFMPVLPFRPHWRPNLRNHRKILVVDGRVGFTGGLNIGDEYRGRKKKIGPWRDTHIELEGPAVWRLQETFVEDWLAATDEDLIDATHFPQIAPMGSELVQVVDSGPDHSHENIQTVLFTAISRAEKRIYITTPYFVPDPTMLQAIKTACWRGLDVRLLLPGKSDMRLVEIAGRSYYQELLDAGAKLYEHRPGILHAKTMMVDGVWATIGSANMDIRSFRLNFELNVLVTGAGFAKQLEEIFISDISRAFPITSEFLAKKRRASRMAEAICRALSPVL